jgi:flagellar motor protein MotB
VSASRITIDGRGEREPIADNSTEAGRARNRRIEIFLAERAPGR